MNKEQLKNRISVLEGVKGGSTYFANENGSSLYNLLLKIDRERKGTIDFIYGNDLLDVMGVENINSYGGQVMLAGAILTKEGLKYLAQLRKELRRLEANDKNE